MALLFKDREALQAVIRSGIISSEVLSSEIKSHVAADHSIILGGTSLPRTTIAKLDKLGVSTKAVLPDSAATMQCWAQTLALVDVKVDVPSQAILMFDDTSELIDVAGELIRLGCERFEVLTTEGFGMMRVVDPPTYTIMRTMDQAGVTVYAPVPGQESIWVELGYKHILSDWVKSSNNNLLLISNDNWISIANAGWQNFDSILELKIPGVDVKLKPVKQSDKRKINLRLTTGRRDITSMWVIRENGISTIDKMLEYLPEDVVSRLTFSVGSGNDPMVILRAKNGRGSIPELSIPDIEEYSNLHQMQDVYVPAGTGVEPPLRRERLRNILNVNSSEILWLVRTEGSKFRVERVMDSDFSPMSDWVDYVVNANAGRIATWMRAVVFEFADFESVDMELVSSKKKQEKADIDRPRPRTNVRSNVLETEAAKPVKLIAKEEEAVFDNSAALPVSTIEIDAELASLESEFLAMDNAADDVNRLQVLKKLAIGYARMKRRRDSGLCFARLAWEADKSDFDSVLDLWIKSESHNPTASFNRIMRDTPVNKEDARLIAVMAARRHEKVAEDHHKVQRWLDANDEDLDTRTMWLAHLGLAELSGGDTLGLASVRDRILQRIAGGLPADRELPAFLRISGRSGTLGGASDKQLEGAMNKLLDSIITTKRKRSPVEAAQELTTPYVNLQFAHGFAKIGNNDRATELASAAMVKMKSLVETDVVHSYLTSAYLARIAQIKDGQLGVPMPDKLIEQLAAIDRVQRYKIDRLREASSILEPVNKPDSMSAFSRNVADSRGKEFAPISAEKNIEKKMVAVNDIIAKAKTDPDNRVRYLDGIMSILVELPESLAMTAFDMVHKLIGTVSPEHQGILLVNALAVAGHFGRADVVSGLLSEVVASFKVISSQDLNKVLQTGLRTLRRIGLRNEIAQLLVEADKAITNSPTSTIKNRLAIASGLAYLKDLTNVAPIIASAKAELAGTMTLAARMDVSRALAMVYAQMPVDMAISGVNDLLVYIKDISDSFGTNSHYCLSVLHFSESLVLGIISDDLVLGETTRRFVEDDELLVRRKIHGDMAKAK